MSEPPMPSMQGMLSSMGPALCGPRLAPSSRARRNAPAASRTRNAMAQADGPCARAKDCAKDCASALMMKLISPWRCSVTFLARWRATTGKPRRSNSVRSSCGEINFIINAEAQSFAQSFARAHGPSACAMAFRVRDAAGAFRRALELGAKRGPQSAGPMELNIPCIEGIGGSLIYLVDLYGERSIYDVDFRPVAGAAGGAPAEGAGLTLIDHLTHNVGRGRMDVWAGFYQKLFNFREIRYFDIEGKHTGLLSRAMTSLCGKIRIPINESQDDKSQIEEYLREYHGEGIQHIALGTNDIYRTVDVLRRHGVAFQSAPDSYYEGVDARVQGHREPLAALKERAILI